MRHRITIQQPTSTRSSFGEMTTAWSTWAIVWASIEPNSGRRYFEAKQANAEVEGLMRIRYRSGLEPTFRISYDGRTFQIISIVQPRENRRELDIYYKEAKD